METEKVFEEMYLSIKHIHDINLGGDEYLRIPAELVENIERDFVPLVDEVFGTDFNEPGNYHRQGFIGRYVSDSNNPFMQKVYLFLSFIDEDFRMWQQPYFVHQSNDGMLNMNDCCCVNDKYPELKQQFRNHTIGGLLSKD